MKISTRLLALVGALIAAMVCLGLLGLYGIERANTSLQTVYEYRTTPAVQLGQVDALTTANRMHVAEALANPTAEVIQASLAAVQANRAEITKLWEDFAALPHAPQEAQLVASYVEHQRAFEARGLLPALQALKDNDITEAQSAMVSQMTPLAVPLKKDIEALKQFQVTAAAEEYRLASDRFAWIRTAALLAMALGCLLGLGWGLQMLRSIMGELGGEPFEANAIAERVGAGDLSQRIALSGADSHSLLAQLNAMQGKLSGVVQQVREAAQRVADASAEIANGNHNLSLRTEQQGSALQETNVSMEALGQAIHENAERATEAFASAQEASELALQCGEAVAHVVMSMKAIHDSSHQIDAIVGVIDAIAFQTNLLALNAAVEAARAGEQGRGFAVVASEVRLLAGRSAGAAKEIKNLIGSSAQRIATGNSQVDVAGDTMANVVKSISSLQQLMGAISAAAVTQSAGIQQVNSALSLMDEGTQQNAALVEEMAAATQGLRQQSDELVESVLQFKLPGTASA